MSGRVLRVPRAFEPSSTHGAPDEGEAPPRRPDAWQERAASRLFLALSPRIRGSRRVVSPAHLRGFAHFRVERRSAPGQAATGRAAPGRAAPGSLAATWYPATASPRGAVLLVHPWLEWGQAYFHRRGRIAALRSAGYHAMTFDLGGFGSSAGVGGAFYDLDLEDALHALERRAGDVPLHLWGVSCGGYWAHMVASRMPIAGAMFEDVSRHLIEWSGRMAPWGRPCYAFFRRCLRQAYRFMDLSRHAPHLMARAAAYVSGGRDRGVLSEETRELARQAGARELIVPEADHLESIKLAGEEVIALALDTFERGARQTIAA